MNNNNNKDDNKQAKRSGSAGGVLGYTYDAYLNRRPSNRAAACTYRTVYDRSGRQ